MLDREAWLEERRKGIGSSDAAAIFGASPWATAVDVYLDKIRKAPLSEETPAMRAGTMLEPLVVDMTRARLETEVEAHPQDQSMEHPDHPVLRATPDAWIHGGGLTGWIVECKVTGGVPWEGVPLHYAIQVQHQLAVTGAPGAIVAQLTRDRLELTLHEVERFEPAIQRIERDLPRWWSEHVLEGSPPPAQTKADVVSIFPRPTSGVIRLDDEAAKLVDVREQARATMKTIKATIDSINDRLAVTLGPAELALLPDGRVVTFRTRKAYVRKAAEVAATRTIGLSKKLPKGVDQSLISNEITPLAEDTPSND